MPTRYARDLNPKQRQAVEVVDGPLLILAGAGSGKTRVLAYRIAHLIGEIGVPPEGVLALTFTNKAAGEMRERVERLVGARISAIWMGTFHAICARILRREANHFLISRDFVIYDADDQLTLIRQVMQQLGISDRQVAPQAVRSYISRAKDRLIGARGYSELAGGFFERQVADIYPAYQQALQDNNAFDFDDLIMRTVGLLQQHRQVLARYQQRFGYLLVDEYQDTNHAQYVLVNLLARKHHNLCVVGDDDQSIYGWRGADISNILNFEKDYPEARVVRLEQNYRSTQTILAAASAVVRNNQGRKDKTLWTTNPQGDQILLLESRDERSEGKALVRKIHEETLQNGIPLGDMAILYRTNAQSRALEDQLRRAGVPYVIVGGLRFFERKEVKDILAYLKLIGNPHDTLSFERVAGLQEGIGKVTMAKVEAFAGEQGISLIEALCRAAEIGLGAVQKKRLGALGAWLRPYWEQRDSAPVDQVARDIVDETGYLQALERERTIEAENRARNVRELLAATEEFRDRAEPPTTTRFLEEVSLLTDIDRWDEQTDAVTLMTLHSAKGLEFSVVFISGLEEGLLPLAHTLSERQELEEERRLFYVGMTRAKKRLYLSYANSRRRFGGIMGSVPSSFLHEIPEQLLVSDQATVSPVADRSDNRARAPFHRYRVGLQIRHPTWGLGQITQTRGWGDNLCLTVRFNGNREKQILVKYVNLEIIG